MSKYTSMMKDALKVRGMMLHANVPTHIQRKNTWVLPIKSTLEQRAICVLFVASPSPAYPQSSFSLRPNPPFLAQWTSVCSLLSLGV